MVEPGAAGEADADPAAEPSAVAPETPAGELLPALLGSARPVAVVGGEGRALGVVTRDALIRALTSDTTTPA
jgi:CBS-domain-containing membrane protein